MSVSDKSSKCRTLRVASEAPIARVIPARPAPSRGDRCCDMGRLGVERDHAAPDVGV